MCNTVIYFTIPLLLNILGHLQCTSQTFYLENFLTLGKLVGTISLTLMPST